MVGSIIKHLRQKTLTSTLLKKIDVKLSDREMQKKLDIIITASNNQQAIAATERILKRNYWHPFSKKCGLPVNYIKEISRFIVSRHTRELLAEDQYSALIQNTEELDCSRLPCEDWKKLFFISICNGLFKISVPIRVKAIESAYTQTNYSSANLERLTNNFKAAMEKGDYEKGEALIEKISQKCNDKAYLDKLYMYLYVLQGKKDQIRSLIQPYYTNIDQSYAKYLEEKNVALVGPAYSEEETGAEIDAHDVVIRFFYRGKEAMPSSKEFGANINVSYYNNESSSMVNKYYDRSFLKDLDYAVFKSIKYSFQHELSNLRRARVLLLPVGFFIGSQNMIPLALYDLLNYHPSKIKVFKINFFLTTKAYYEGYQQDDLDAYGYSKQWYNFAVHEPLAQLNFVRNLWKAGQIEVDKACEAVLHLSHEEYMSKMEEIYVEHPIKTRTQKKHVTAL